ncbi:MAG: hypothetical protein ICV62_14915 [Cyanobacteria bacterium Co-bin13]|nr:hypothetical protein [Cyanobacteria bacterium Co-bin13]
MAIDIKTLRQQPVYQASTPAAALLDELNSLTLVDAEVEQKLKTANILLWSGIAVAFVSVFLFAVVIGFIMLPVGLGLAIWGGISRQRLVKINIPNYRYELLIQVLQMLLRDMDPDQPVDVKLGLTPAERPEKKIDTIPHPSRARWNIDRYVDPWLELSSELLDGTRFTLSATELFQSHHGWKRSRSGKQKHKRKPKPKGQVLNLQLAFSRRKYSAVTQLSDLQTAIQLPATARLKALENRDNKIMLEVKSAPPPVADGLYETISLMFLSVYQILNLSRELSKQP